METKEKRISYVINTQPELSQVLQSMETMLSDEDADDGTDADSSTDKGSRIDEDSGTDKDTKTGTTENGNTTTTYYFYGNGLTAQDNGKDYFVYHFNNVGSTMAVTDVKGSVVEAYHYMPYGELIDGEYREDIPFLYNGQYGVTTDGNGLYYMRARYYNVEIKRFINQDVLLGILERISSLNRYAYVEGNPVSYLDPFGLDRIDTSDLHEFLLDISFISTILCFFDLPVGYLLGSEVNTLDLWVTCFDLGYDTATENYEDSMEDLVYILYDILGILTSFNLLSIKTGEASRLISESKKGLQDINNTTTIGLYYYTVIDKCKKLIDRVVSESRHKIVKL